MSIQLSQTCISFVVISMLIVHNLAPSSVAQAMSFDREMLRKYFSCPVCDPYSCPEPEGYHTGCELVLEPGVCACCQVCARGVGDRCGVSEGRCGIGLACRPLPGDPDQLGAILNGRAVCI